MMALRVARDSVRREQELSLTTNLSPATLPKRARLESGCGHDELQTSQSLKSDKEAVDAAPTANVSANARAIHTANVTSRSPPGTTVDAGGLEPLTLTRCDPAGQFQLLGNLGITDKHAQGVIMSLRSATPQD
jgi:hypothetical protein